MKLRTAKCSFIILDKMKNEIKNKIKKTKKLIITIKEINAHLNGIDNSACDSAHPNHHNKGQQPYFH